MDVWKWTAALSCVVALLAAGCSGRKVLNVDNAPVVTSKGAPSEDEVLKAILRAGVITQWKMTPMSGGNIYAERNEGSHRANVFIGYSAQQYSIRFADTNMVDQPQQLGYMGGTPGGARAAPPPTTVHRTYNVWVQQLDQQIRAQLLSLGL